MKANNVVNLDSMHYFPEANLCYSSNINISPALVFNLGEAPRNQAEGSNLESVYALASSLAAPTSKSKTVSSSFTELKGAGGNIEKNSRVRVSRFCSS